MWVWRSYEKFLRNCSLFLSSVPLIEVKCFEFEEAHGSANSFELKMCTYASCHNGSESLCVSWHSSVAVLY